jgi:hypothetical protein
MAECEFLHQCTFFNDEIQDMPYKSKMLKKFYCESDNRMCTRYRFYKNEEANNMPLNLLPDQKDPLGQILGLSEYF